MAEEAEAECRPTAAAEVVVDAPHLTAAAVAAAAELPAADSAEAEDTPQHRAVVVEAARATTAAATTAGTKTENWQRILLPTENGASGAVFIAQNVAEKSAPK